MSPFQNSQGGQYSVNSHNASYPSSYHYPGNQYQSPGGTPGGYSYQTPPGSYVVNNQGDTERFYQNLSVYRSQDGFNKNKVMTPEER